MKKTFIRLNKMPENGEMPKGLNGNELVILTTPEKNEVMDIVRPAGAVNWESQSTHFIVLETDSKTLGV